jgi:hypothetical protein
LEAPEFGRSRFCKNKSGFDNLYEGFDDTKVLKEQLVLLIYVQVCGTKIEYKSTLNMQKRS